MKKGGRVRPGQSRSRPLTHYFAVPDKKNLELASSQVVQFISIDVFVVVFTVELYR